MIGGGGIVGRVKPRPDIALVNVTAARRLHNAGSDWLEAAVMG